ncbi:cytochrome P450 [Streptomyces goshikiensis]|uniref:cytochrome P450 n=1 Tax=Streptomyces goshikiensis TaxID=1942 RepID=UPI0036BD6EFC
MITPLSDTALRDADLFSDETLADPYPLFAALREIGPVVYLPRHDLYAVVRHAAVREAVNDPERFSSDHGIALNSTANDQILLDAVLASDGATHARLRRVLSAQLAPRAIAQLRASILEHAGELADRVVAAETFDAMHDLAVPFVTGVVTELMGLPSEGNSRLAGWADATFNIFGPDNERTRASLPHSHAMMQYLSQAAHRDQVRPGSWLHAIYQAADAGKIAESECLPLMTAYTVASIDTTIQAITNALRLLARYPQQWRDLREDPASLAPAAFRETLRYEAPIQALGRRITRDTELRGVPLPAGRQLWLLYGSAGRDRLQWGTDADRFDIHRPGTEQQLSLGDGPHLCAGNHLAAMEATAMLTMLAERAPHLALDTAAPPARRRLNNVLRGWTTMPLSVSHEPPPAAS